MKRKPGLFMFIVIAVPLAACSRGGDDHNHPELVTGAALYSYHCVSCHGEDGTGKLVDQTPAAILTQRSRQGVIDYITTDIGLKRKMPVFSAMPRGEADTIAAHLQQLRGRYDALPENRKKSEALMVRP